MLDFTKPFVLKPVRITLYYGITEYHALTQTSSRSHANISDSGDISNRLWYDKMIPSRTIISLCVMQYDITAPNGVVGSLERIQSYVSS